jgi:hypothetical protein
MPNGDNCHGYALKGEHLCYFHSRVHRAAKKPLTGMESIEIPLLEDRCAIQVTITGILSAIVNKTIDRPRAALLLYGLQLALQSVDRSNWAIPFGTVKAVSHTPDGDELAADPCDGEDEEEYEGAHEADDASGDDDSDSGDSDEAEASGNEDETNDSNDDDDSDDGLDNQTTEELIAQHRYLQSISEAVEAGDMRLAARLLAKSG